MKFISTLCLSLLVIITFTLFSCSDKTEEFVSEPLSDYIPLQLGKYITYRIDSLVFTNFGRDIEIHKYQVKHVVDAQITDNLGRPSYRIFTYLSDSTGMEGWTPNGSYFITPVTNQMEVIENNLRVIKLHQPIRDGYEWKGNAYLPIDPYDSRDPLNSYDFGMNEWDFYYDGEAEPAVSIQGQTYNDVFTVEQRDDAFNAPVAIDDVYGFKNRSIEKYSKNIGLVYREYELWEYEPNTSGSSPYYKGFGITMWMIDHN
jgi:hypothetical protein